LKFKEFRHAVAHRIRSVGKLSQLDLGVGSLFGKLAQFIVFSGDCRRYVVLASRDAQAPAGRRKVSSFRSF
jgi:hypothetical protein